MKIINLALPPHILAIKLLDWYDENHRILPWRVSPQDRHKMRGCGEMPDPYHVWLSEMMLQQTMVATVKDYFQKFITRWPNIHALSAASLDDVLQMWAGLGYYSRARNLKAAADRIVTFHEGIFPKDYDSLRALPGIGAYSAAAIMAIAYDKPYSVIDGNVERIMSRLKAIDEPKPASRNRIEEQLVRLVPTVRAGDFAQAMMDLGATLCRPVQANCPECPWQEDCEAAKRGEVANFPRKRPKVQKPLRTGAAFVMRSQQGRILLQKRPASGLLAGMSEVPNHFGEHVSKQAFEAAPIKGAWHYQGDVVHIFTHFRLEISVYLLTDVDEGEYDHGWWVDEAALKDQALPTLMKKILAKIYLKAFK